jgi:ATP-dependent helicase HrpB
MLHGRGEFPRARFVFPHGQGARPLEPLPIDPYVPEILAAVESRRALVLTAEPGAGKTTRVAPALAERGRTLLLQPRRVAARSLARYIAAERGWSLGEDVGWQVRFERRFTPRTRLLVATEGVLAARAQRDPLLSGFATIVLDEFHERSVHADLALALSRQAWLARDDLRLVVMSATLDPAAVAAFLRGCPILHAPGRRFPIDVAYAPEQPLDEAVAQALARRSGQVLVFLPGAPEIRRAAPVVAPRARAAGAEVVALHGSLPAEEQDEAIRPVDQRRVILATNIAETSLTVPGVTAVIDSGLHKVARFDPARGIDSLDVERISQDAAEQRAGRAGRTAPGLVCRLWDARDRLRPRREPEIERVDLAGVVLDVLAWGGDPASLEWLTPPPAERLDAAWQLLARLGAVEGRRLTPAGDRLRGLPLHPRLGRILLEGRGSWEAAAACALLSERLLLPPRAATTSSDLLSAIDHWDSLPTHVVRAAREIERIARDLVESPRAHIGEAEFRKAVLAAYPDRVARRRADASLNLLLCSGHGAVLSGESGVRSGEFLVAIDVQAATPPPGRESAVRAQALVRVATAIEREWLAPTATAVEHRFDEASGRVQAFEVDRYDDLVLAERIVPADPEMAAGLLARHWLDRGPAAEEQRLLRRARFAGVPLDLPALVRGAALSARAVGEIDIASQVPRDTRATIDRLAPTSLVVPSGRAVRLEYREDGAVEAAVKLQELFGLAETPLVGPRREPVLFALLAPNGRAVQVTRDLRSFWERGYPEVRKELRGRYPRHPWPEDPWTATPTARTKKRA